ncbi:Tyrosine recombinase XerC [anaerobic digester metagenome]
MLNRAPTLADSRYHGDRSGYSSASFAIAEEGGILSPEDRTYITEFINDLRACKGISLGRQNKLTTHLCHWRRFIGPYDQNTIDDLTAGVNALRAAKSSTGRAYKTNTIIDYILILKQFYTWMIDREYSSVPEKRLRKITAPPKPRMTKTAADILSPEEVTSFLSACTNSRDRALFSLLYEAGLRPGEAGTLTWRQLDFDEYGAIVNLDFKTGRPRYVRLLMSTEVLAQWRRDYPLEQTPDSLVFLNRLQEPLTYATMAKQMQVIAKRAGISKHLTLHLFRHSRITHLVREGVPIPVVGMLFWGDPTARELETYLHLVNTDVDRAMLAHYGIKSERSLEPERVEVHECPRCHTIAGPGIRFCGRCGLGLTDMAATTVAALKGDITLDLVRQMIEEALAERKTG